MIDKYIIKFCEAIDNFFDALAKMFESKPKKKRKKKKCKDCHCDCHCQDQLHLHNDMQELCVCDNCAC